MHLIGKVSVFPKLPDNISRLHELAYNLWWSWETEAQALFASHRLAISGTRPTTTRSSFCAV